MKRTEFEKAAGRCLTLADGEARREGRKASMRTRREAAKRERMEREADAAQVIA